MVAANIGTARHKAIPNFVFLPTRRQKNGKNNKTLLKKMRILQIENTYSGVRNLKAATKGNLNAYQRLPTKAQKNHTVH
jgi:hypothetical protein